jgi:hypothetical protein
VGSFSTLGDVFYRPHALISPICSDNECGHLILRF